MPTFFAKFEKVSFEQFQKDYCDYMRTFGLQYEEEFVKAVYDNIKLPSRSTQAGACYDFYLPTSMPLHTDKCQVPIPTGIRCALTEANVLLLLPCSFSSMKNGMRLNNAVDVVDADYYFSDNEGHIMLSMSCEYDGMMFNAGTKIARGLITHYCLAEEVPTERKHIDGFDVAKSAVIDKPKATNFQYYYAKNEDSLRDETVQYGIDFEPDDDDVIANLF